MEKQEKWQREQQINENLRRVYQQVVEEEVPDRFKELLDKLKAQENSQ